MKKMLLFLMFVSFLGGNPTKAQERSDPKELALLWLKVELKDIKDLTPEQLNQLAEIDVKIDKEHPFLTGMNYSNRKARTNLLLSIYALKEKLYPNVLTPEQNEQFKVILQKDREMLQKPTPKKQKP